jgi:protein-S-isoprenylcysteine O-methyltransferase Ste14
LYVLLSTAVLLVVIGLDERFGWTGELPLWVQLAGIALLLLSFYVISWSMASNRFFSGVVRIQEDRGHSVVTGGPYRFVRHPGYVGLVILACSVPLMLSSLWALVPAGLTVIVIVIRTALEDRTFQKELDGYTGYAQKVRFRLIPGIW